MSLLEMKDIKKSFNGVEVLHGIQLKLQQGSVHALMGENGAGKSTMMKIIAGVYKKDGGSISIRGQAVEINSPTESQKLGIAMIHQELSPIPEMTVAENIFLAREPKKNLFIDYKGMYKQTEELLRDLHIHVKPKDKLKNLKVADQQLVEIAKAISYNADIIIMDEPTSAITDKEVDNLFEIIKSLKAKGKGIIYISHKMDEIFRISDEISVLRDGSYVNTWKSRDIDNNTLIKNMVGRELNEIFPKVSVPISDTVLEVKDLSIKGKFSNISFQLKKGEILGIAGLVGAGRTEVMNAIFGLDPAESGEIIIRGKKCHITKPQDAISKGIAYVTEDRKLEGLILQMSVGHNISLPSMKKMCKGFFIRNNVEKTIVQEQVEALRIKLHNTSQLVSRLSGGNQQKIVLAKWLVRNPSILILDEPTRGIDVGAKAEIYKLMGEFVKKGNSIIMISSEMPEVMGMADRILIFSNGILSGQLQREEFTQESIMHFAVANV